MKKRICRIIEEVSQRWKDTILGKTPVNVNIARKIIKACDSKAQIFEVETPKQFYIAQSVMRGRISKDRAKRFCKALEIDAEFLQSLRRIGGPMPVFHGKSWWFRNQPTNIENILVQEYLLTATGAKKRVRRFSRRLSAADADFNQIMLCNLSDLHDMYVPAPWRQMTRQAMNSKEATKLQAKLVELRNGIGWDNRRFNGVVVTRFDAVSGNTQDILNDNYNVSNHLFDATQAEILARAMNIKDQAVTMCYEIFHHVPAFMRFRNGFLLMSKIPEVHFNEEQLLHNDSGPAVKWADNSAMWFIDGHRLLQFGEKIVTAPKTITVEEIAEINNEEERRIAIDRYGWGEYLEASGGRVLDYRENWVDNTVEVLIAPVEIASAKSGLQGRNWRPEQPLRMVLACRSTGRKYFIGVPNSAETLLNLDRNSADKTALPLPNCELAQKWLAQGAVSEFLPYAKHSLNIVGAS